MPVEERLMLPGAWSLRLSEDTPKATRDLLAYFGHIMVLPTQVDPRRFSDANMKAFARYTGRLTRRPTVFDLGGDGLVAWLADAQDKGAIYETAQTLTNGTFSGWITQLLPTSIAAGSITAIAGTLTATYQWITPRKALNNIMEFFGGNYRVNPDATFDAGLPSDIFKTTPTAIVQRWPGGRDSSIIGVPASTLTLNTDVDDYSTRILYQTGGVTAPNYFANASATPYKDLRGNAALLSRIVTDSNTPNSAAGQTYANSEAVTWSVTRQLVSLSTIQYDIRRDVGVGDNIWVWDPQRGLSDVTNQVRYRGSILFPTKVQVLAINWPIEQGLGIYYRDSAGAYTDLTRFVEWESPGATFEVGSALRKFTQ